LTSSGFQPHVTNAGMAFTTDDGGLGGYSTGLFGEGSGAAQGTWSNSNGHSFVFRAKFSGVVPAATPIPAALPLFVAALGGLAFAAWRRPQNAA
jgi:hypothetical protein